MTIGGQFDTRTITTPKQKAVKAGFYRKAVEVCYIPSPVTDILLLLFSASARDHVCILSSEPASGFEQAVHYKYDWELSQSYTKNQHTAQ